MKLRLKFNLMLIAVFRLALAAAGFLSFKQLSENAEQEVLGNAGVLMESLLSARTWAVVEVGPNLREIEEGEDYLMMGVPPYASKKVMAGIQKRYPDYKYRELALNPLNLKDHYPEDWERQIINLFRIDQGDFLGRRDQARLVLQPVAGADFEDLDPLTHRPAPGKNPAHRMSAAPRSRRPPEMRALPEGAPNRRQASDRGPSAHKTVQQKG